MTPLASLSDPNYVRGQYQSASNLNARIRLHQQFSTNPYGWQRWVFDQLPLAPGSRVLELGCGPADLWRENLERIPPDLSLLLSDQSDGMVAQAGANLAGDETQPKTIGYTQRFHLCTLDAQQIPFPDHAFNLVIANHMLFHVPDRPRALREMRRVLKPDGALIATTMGESSMKELTGLVGRFDPQLASYGQLPSNSFTLENGTAQLKPYFAAVELYRYADALRVTEVEPLIDYLLSGRLELSPDRQAALIQFVRGEFEASRGEFYINKDAGLFKAYPQASAGEDAPAGSLHMTILEIGQDHPSWERFLSMVVTLGEVETHRVTLEAEHFISSHILVAFEGDQPVGYLRFVIQRIGEDEERPLVTFKGKPLEEAKVITFAVVPEHRNRGIGRLLQVEAMRRARAMGCYQFRSRSEYTCRANHHLKISMGFGIQPSLQNDSVYFVLPLQDHMP